MITYWWQRELEGVFHSFSLFYLCWNGRLVTALPCCSLSWAMSQGECSPVEVRHWGLVQKDQLVTYNHPPLTKTPESSWRLLRVHWTEIWNPLAPYEPFSDKETNGTAWNGGREFHGKARHWTKCEPGSTRRHRLKSVLCCETWNYSILYLLCRSPRSA